jgi:hypothetical protein
MSERAAEVYLDEDVAAVVAPMLRGRGFRATTTLEQSRTGATDVEQVEFAASKGWASSRTTARTSYGLQRSSPQVDEVTPASWS